MANLGKSNTLEVSNKLNYLSLYDKLEDSKHKKMQIKFEYTVCILTTANIAFWILNTIIFKMSYGSAFLFGMLLLAFSAVQCFTLIKCFDRSDKVYDKDLSMSLEMCNVKDIKSFKDNIETLKSRYKAMKIVYKSYNVDKDSYIDTILTKYYNPESLIPSKQLNDAFDDVKASLKGE